MSTETSSNASQKLSEFATKEQHEKVLEGFTGTEHYYPCLDGPLILTEGTMYAYDELGIFWFFNAILETIAVRKDLSNQGFYVWSYNSTNTHSYEITCTDGNKNVLVTVFVPKDFHGELPVFEEFTIWSDGDVYYLPSEH